MNRKVLLTVLALAVALLATPYIGTVMAGMGQEKLSIKFVVGSYQSGTESYDNVWNSPKKVEFPAEISRVLHIRGGDWGDPATHTGFSIVLDEADLDIEFDNEDIDYSCSYHADAVNMLYGQEAPPYVIMNIKVSERWEISNGAYEGYIEISTAERVYDYLSMYEGLHTEGSFVGHGVINGQNVKLSGEAGDAPATTGIYRVGTVMGWPTP